MKKRTSTLLSQFYKLLLRYEGIILLLAFQLLLRIPNLFEPYWYGDEGIYLVVGNAMRHGLRLYAETMDHKTPIIYFLAMVPSQFWFRMVLIVSSTLSTLFFFLLTKRLQFKPLQQYIATFVFIMFTTLPWLEGNIPNGELFVMTFLLIGAWIFTHTKFFELYLAEKIVPIKSVMCKSEVKIIAVAGFFFALAILTKVPAVFDIAPFFSLGYFTIVDHFSIKRSRKVAFSVLGLWEILGVAIFLPILMSFLYFAMRGTLQAYIDIGILYNFRYAGTWSLPQLPLGLSFFLTMPGKLVIIAAVMLLLTIKSNRISARTQFLITWALFSLFGALLSSRPYPHYLLQIVPAFSLLIGALAEKFHNRTEKVAMTIPLVLLIGALYAVGFGFYRTGKYYKNFLTYVSGRYTTQEYYQTFDYLMNDNYKAATILMQDPDPRTFIWGTNPTLYALAKKIPTGRFITAFHIADFPGAFDETFEDLSTHHPEFIVVMKGEKHKFPQFFTFLELNYLPYKELDLMIIYKRSDVL
jgi:hypothetical protein